MTHNYDMRTTIDITDHLLIQAKQAALTRRMTLRAIFEESLRLYLSKTQQEQKPLLRGLPTADMAKPVQGLDLNDSSKLWEL